jgi:hypothetical protein
MTHADDRLAASKYVFYPGIFHVNFSSIYFAAENLFLWARLETTGDAIEN